MYKLILGNSYYYIGSTTCYGRRKSDHLRELRKQYHNNSAMQNIWNKYPEEYEFIVLEEVHDEEILLQIEQKYIDENIGNPKCINICREAHKPNVRRGKDHHYYGIPFARGRVFSEEIRKRMSEARKGTKHTQEAKDKMSLAHMGHKRSKESIEKTASKLRGRKRPKFSKEWRDNISKSGIGRKSARRKKLVIIFPNGKEQIYSHITEAAEKLGVARRTLGMWLNGQNPFPGSGSHVTTKTKHLLGITGYFLEDNHANID